MTLKERAERLWRELKRCHRGKAVGALVGLLGGWFGAAMGFVIGYMMDTLLAQRKTDRAVAAYLENPGPSAFAERIPGSAAFCALAAAILASGGEVSPSRVERLARGCFGAREEDSAEIETYSRVAAANADLLNPDLLSESLRARRLRAGDTPSGLGAICAALESLASGGRAAELASRVRGLLSPECGPGPESERTDPYLILGVDPGAALEEVKTAYRRLAVSFHPDASVGLDEAQARSAAEAFLIVDGAYRRILSERES